MTKSKSAYAVISAPDLGILQEQVNSAMQAGFVPSGSMVIAQSDLNMWFYQPMVYLSTTQLAEGESSDSK